MRDFLSGISREISMFFPNPEKNKSRNREISKAISISAAKPKS
jgi:hypothetical protein